ncbi:NAD-dependent epimerase/dehydratase family protein [Nonomuraea sp. NPDC049649]|uniref:SDR family oxidoreductase n=1 Tax=Nonomuraea sp. NPDC049649 TaxID=3155776 RepID=UPI00343B9023
MKIVVIGGTGLIGSKLVANLREQGHEAVAASPRTGVNAVTGEGLAEALEGASVVVDVSNPPTLEGSAAREFFETSGRNLLAAVGEPLNGRVEVAGPEQFQMDEFFREVLASWGDSREVVTDPHADYFGTELRERSLVPDDGAALGAIRYRDWR